MTDRWVLIVDDDHEMALAVADILRGGDTRCELVTCGISALEACRRFSFDVVVSDIRMAGMDGLELMAHLRQMQPALPVILVTAEGSIGAAVEAAKHGAFQYLVKPFDGHELRGAVDDAVALHPRAQRASPESLVEAGMSELLGTSAAMMKLREKIHLVAAASSPVLVMGETGTGKELVAQAIHRCSPRHARPFVTVNAAAVPESLLESEMFGHVRGAFTGATQTHRGLFNEANGGTLFLDEIGDMPLGLQSKLLRVLQSGEVRSVGSGRLDCVDVRVIAATHRSLPELVKDGRFREDLYYRLDVISIKVPPLRARKGDIPRLATTFVARARERAPQSVVSSLSDDLVALLSAGHWPGNVRELQSTIERLVVLACAEVAEPRHLDLVEGELGWRPVTGTNAPAVDLRSTIDEVVHAHVERVLACTEGHKARAAKILGVDLSTLYRWQQKWRP
jgi:two-component system response regulator HydG